MVQLRLIYLSVQYGDIKALKGISFKIEQGDFVTLFGEAFEELAPGAKLAAIFNNYENR